jgi:hypothetical protein
MPVLVFLGELVFAYEHEVHKHAVLREHVSSEIRDAPIHG